MAFFVLSNRDSWFSLELELKVSPIFWEVDFSPCKEYVLEWTTVQSGVKGVPEAASSKLSSQWYP